MLAHIVCNRATKPCAKYAANDGADDAHFRKKPCKDTATEQLPPWQVLQIKSTVGRCGFGRLCWW
jgi:hypothetical protein